MTDGSGKKLTWAQLLGQRVVKSSLDLAVFGVIGLLTLLFFNPLKVRVEAIVDAPANMQAFQSDLTLTLSEIRAELSGLRASVNELKRPNRVFDTSAFNTKPVEGYCVTDEACTIQVRVWRLPEAVACRVVPNSVRWGFYNPREDVFVEAQKLDPSNDRNIPTNKSDFYVTLLTPHNLEPDAEFAFSLAYTSCPGTAPNDPPLRYFSPRHSFTILPSNPKP